MSVARKVDANQTEIVKAFRKMGCLVHITSQLGKGFPDLVVGIGIDLFLVEVKDGSKPLSKQALTPQEAEFHKLWGAHVIIINSVDQAIELVNLTRTARQ